MSKIPKMITIALAFISSVGLANAFGYFRKNYDMLDVMGMHGFGLFAGLGLLALIGIVILFVFWLLMLVDCLKRDFKKDIDKVVWVLVLIFLHLLGALVYYFVVRIAGRESAGKGRRK